MPSIRELIVQNFVTALTGAVPAGQIHRSRLTAIQRSESPAIVVQARREDHEVLRSGGSNRLLTIGMEIIARGDAPDSVADATVSVAHQRVMADPTRSGKALDTSEISTEWEIAEADLDAVIVTVIYQILYRTDMRYLTVQMP